MYLGSYTTGQQCFGYGITARNRKRRRRYYLVAFMQLDAYLQAGVGGLLATAHGEPEAIIVHVVVPQQQRAQHRLLVVLLDKPLGRHGLRHAPRHRGQVALGQVQQYHARLQAAAQVQQRMEGERSDVRPAPARRALLHVLLVLDPARRLTPLGRLAARALRHQLVQLHEHLQHATAALATDRQTHTQRKNTDELPHRVWAVVAHLVVREETLQLLVAVLASHAYGRTLRSATRGR